jgi:hypothetical protein
MSNGNDWSSDTNGNKKSEKGLPTVTVYGIESTKGDHAKAVMIAYTCSAGSENCDEVRAMMKQMNNAAKDPSITGSDRSRIGAVFNAYGKEGEPGVDIKDDQNLDAGGVTHRNEDGSDTVSIKFPGVRDPVWDAHVLVHEGQHVLNDETRGRDINSLQERRATEESAYTTEAIYLKSVQIQPSTGIFSYTQGIDQKQIDIQVQKSIEHACGSGVSASSSQSCH